MNYPLSMRLLSGLFDSKEVAVKIVIDDEFIQQEIAMYRALGAFNNPKIESSGIPRIYYSGSFIKNHTALAMTLMDGSLEDRHATQEYTFNAYSTMQVLLQSVRKSEVKEKRIYENLTSLLMKFRSKH